MKHTVYTRARELEQEFMACVRPAARLYTPAEVDALVLAERERCAGLCDALQSAEEEGWSEAASFLAGEIRKG